MSAAGEAGVEMDELIAMLSGGQLPVPDRDWAMAQYLSGAEGWRDAETVLRGTFGGFATAVVAPATGLTGGQEE